MMFSSFLSPASVYQRRHAALFSESLLGDLIDTHLAKVGIEGIVLLVLDAGGSPVCNYNKGFNEQQMACYQLHRHDDVYMNYYLQHPSFWGSLQYLQQRLPLRKITNQTFLDVIYPTVAFKHTLSGFRSLAYGYRLLFSCHREHSFSLKEQHYIEGVFALLQDWGNHQLSLYHMQKSLALCQDVERGVELLTEAEWQVLLLLIEGFDGSEIACLRYTSKETVRSQIKSLLRKTHSRNQNQLIARYFIDPQLFKV